MFNFRDWWSRVVRPGGPAAADSLDAFGSEQPVAKPAELRRAAVGFSADRLQHLRAPVAIAVAIAILFIVAAGGYVATGYVARNWKPFNVEAASASLTIESDPSGAEVLAGGVRKGTTPLMMAVAPGEHTFELVSGTRRKSLRTVARAGAAVVHHVQFDSAPPAATKASLSVVTDPAKLRVLLDGKALGVSPLLVADLEPGSHTVQVVGAAGTLQRKVDLYAGETASVIISARPPASAGPSVGWLTVSAPIPLQIVQGTNLIGTSQTAKIMLPAGRHDLQLTNETLGVSERRTVQVSAGATATIRVDVPSAPLSINALPWAQAWVDGKLVGETPIGNHKVSVGTHEIIFRHPELGERRQTVTVSLKSPARASVDMRKPQ
ncbi:MAG: PEGA domain-containing protein [Acidobacteria bacterium]|nr:PEGA domain-containing protein [Acidobacteriota bacterium]